MHLKIKTNNTTVSNYFSSKKYNFSDDSGLDVIVPKDIIIPKKALGFKINLDLTLEPSFDDGNIRGYYIFPRSSISKTPLRLANSVGIIDFGYRGNLIAVVDNLSDEDYTIECGTRLFQVCSPDLSPITFELIEDELSKSERGEGGFGSTDDRVSTDKSYMLYFDGASRGNPGPGAAAAIIIEKSTNKIVWTGCKYFHYSVTCNVAEYEALLLGVTAMKNYNFNNITLMGDSQLVINQVKKLWKCKNEVLKEYLQKVANKLVDVNYNAIHIPREKNCNADKLANECLDNRKGFSKITEDGTR